MPGSLVSIDAWNRRTASRETVRVGSALNSVTLGADGFTWEPALRRAPRLSMQLADVDLTGAVQLGQAELAVNAKMLTRVSDWRDLDWVGSTVRIYSGDSPFLSSMGTELIGRIYGGVTDPETGIASLQLEADRAIVDVPLLTRTYAGTGGAEGDPELRGNFKPAAFGSPINVPPLLINALLFIYQVDAYGALTSFAGVYEDLASFGPAKANYATYDELAAAALGGGEWATCNALGMFRLGANPTGTITCDPVCGFGLPGEMMLRWLTTHAGVPASRIRSASFAALTAAVQIAVGNAPGVSFWTSDEGNVLDLMQRMCASCNAVPLLLLDGTIAVSRVMGGGLAVTLQRQGGTPPVTGWARQDPAVPWWRMRMTAARAFYVNSASEIDYEDDIRLRGGYIATETYRQGDVVIGSDGAQYLFINPTPTKGIAPPNTAYWDVYTNAPDATQIKYPSGYTLAEKEPQEKGANVTENRTSIGFQGQDVLATLPAVWFGSPYLLEGSGGVAATLDAFKTILGNALGIQGQGLLATLSSITDGYLSGNLATRVAGWGPDTRFLNASAVAFAAGNTIEGLKPGEAGANITESRNSLGFQGQGALATLAFVQFGSSRTVTTSDGTTVTDQVVVTAAGVSLGFQGQGGLATMDQAGYFELKLDELRSNTNDSMRRGYSQSLYAGTSYVPRGETPNNADAGNVPPGYTPLGYDQNIKAGGTFYVTVNGIHQTFGSSTQNTFVAFMLLDTGNNVLAMVRMPTGTLTNYLFIIPNTWGTRTVRWRVRVMSDGNNWSAVVGVGGDTYVVDVAWKAL